jgi:hypothetical protein
MVVNLYPVKGTPFRPHIPTVKNRQPAVAQFDRDRGE